MCDNVQKPYYRFLVLFFNCMITFGSYYCFDMPSVLQDVMTKDYKCNKSENATCCEECLGMSPEQYNLLYAVYSWTNAVVVIGAGYFADKVGNQVSAIVFSTCCVLGSSIFALGSMYRGTAYLLPLMLLGRLIFGAGNGSLTVVQNRITSFWFAGKELALAFGVTLAFSRLGSVLNFFLTNHICDAVGLHDTLWIGAGLCGLGFISAVIVGVLDTNGFKKLGMLETLSVQSKNVKITDFRHFSICYWLLALTIMFFYNGVFPFVADASKYIKDKYGYNDDVASYIAGAVYDVSLVLSPFLGGLIDIFGKRGYLSIICSLATIPVFGLLAFTYVHPLVSTLWLGVTYSIAAACMWPSIPLVVSSATIGTAMGIATSMQMIGIGFSNLIVGKILGSKDDLSKDIILLHWKYVMVYLLCNTLGAVATSATLIIFDKRKKGLLNLSRKEAKALSKCANVASSSDVKALVDPSENINDNE